MTSPAVTVTLSDTGPPAADTGPPAADTGPPAADTGPPAGDTGPPLIDTARHWMQLKRPGVVSARCRDAGRVIGMLSIGGLIKAVIEEQSAHIDRLGHYIGG